VNKNGAIIEPTVIVVSRMAVGAT